MTQPVQPSPVTPIENVQRGTVVALIIIPVGIVVWDLIWSFGFVASIVAFGVAFGALWLYRLGAGGVVGRQGAIRIVIITIVTMLLAFFGGMVTDVLKVYSTATGKNWAVGLTDPLFWKGFWSIIGEGEYLGSIALPLLLAAAFAFLGSFRILRSTLRATRAPQVPAGYQPYPTVPGQAYQQYPGQVPGQAPQQYPGQAPAGYQYPTQPPVPGQAPGYQNPAQPQAPGQYPAQPPVPGQAPAGYQYPAQPPVPPVAPGQTYLNGEPLPPTKD